MRNRTSKTGNQMPAVSGEVIGERTAAWLRQAFPGDNRAKLIAREFDCDERTAKAWLAGEPPQLHRHWHAMVGKWGKAFLAFVYQPFDWSAQLEIEARLDALEQEAAALRERLSGKD